MPDFTTMTATDIAEGVCKGAFKAEDVARGCLAQAMRLEPKLNAMLYLDEKSVLEQAMAVDAAPRKGRLAGVPIVVKDNINVRGMPMTCGSKILKGYTSIYDATVIARLRAEGAVFLGKANLDEFAMGSSCEHSAYGPTRNPWDTSRVPGGSSGGSAAAVAAGYAPLALGTDTGGSVRQPGALTGTIGIKPTYGRVSRYGAVAFASSLDQIGPFARNVRDAALCLDIMSGQDGDDATTLAEKPLESAGSLAKPDTRGLRVGVVPGHLGPGCAESVKKAIASVTKAFGSLGANVVPIDMPNADYGVQVYYVLASSEASSNLARFDGVRYGPRADSTSVGALYTKSRGQGFGAEVKRRIMLGTFALSAGYQDAYYKKALAVRDLIKQEYHAVFAKCDVILGPTSPTTAFRLGEKTSDPLSMYLSDVYTICANVAGVPAVSVPCGFDEGGLPIGVHIQAPFGQDVRLLQVAAAVESVVAPVVAGRRPAIAAA